IFGRHVQITPDYSRRFRIDGILKPSRQPVEPFELGGIEWRIHDPAVRRVDTNDAHAPTLGRDHPRFGHRFIITGFRGARRRKRLTKISYDRTDTAAARDRNAIPAPFTMMNKFVFGVPE